MKVFHRSFKEFQTVDDRELYEIVTREEASANLSDALFSGFSMSQVSRGIYMPSTDTLHAVTVEEWDEGLRTVPSNEDTNPILQAFENCRITDSDPVVGTFNGDMLEDAQELYKYRQVGEGGLVAACVQIIAWDK